MVASVVAWQQKAKNTQKNNPKPTENKKKHAKTFGNRSFFLYLCIDNNN